MQTFNEATVLALMVSARKEGRFAHPAIVQKGTNVMIDGFHRTEAVSRLAAEGLEIHLGLDEYETDDPAGLAQDINKTRRSWTTKEERRTQVQFLATQTDAEGKSFSIRQIADAVGSSATTVRRDKAKVASVPNGAVAAPPPGVPNGTPGAKPATCSKGKDGKGYSPPATEAEIARAWSMKDSGMSNAAIAKDLDRPARTISGWFAKGRPEAVPDPAPAPEPKTVPTDDFPAVLPALSVQIIKAEKKAAPKRTASFGALVELNAHMEKLWKAAQKNFTDHGRSVLRNHMGLADADMVRNGVIATQCEALGLPADATYLEMLKEVDATAKKLSQSARTAIYLLGYTETLEP